MEGTYKDSQISCQAYLGLSTQVRSIHLFNHSFTCPGTRLDLQLNSDDTPITKSINRVDAAAYKHDLVYRDHAADLQMIQELQSIPNPIFHEKVERAIVIRLLWAKMKLGMEYADELHCEFRKTRTPLESESL